MHLIENDFLRVKARDFGAELTSILDKRTGIEHLWQADQKFWGWHAPVLFPVVGRCLNDEINIDGKCYKMEKHGFARKSTFTLLELGTDKMVFRLIANDDTKAIYPFNFEFLIGYYLRGSTLVCNYEVINRDTKNVLFSLGGHPAFSVPFFEDEKYEDYYLEFELEENSTRHFIDENGFFNGREEVVLNNSRTLSLQTEMFNNDAYIFKDLQSRAVTIKSDKHQHTLTVRYPGFNYLGLWAKPNAHYICIEPWLGCADTAGKKTDFSKKEGILTLPQGEKFCRSIIIELGGQ
jgi:galactose mutarotase-like enzyme